MGIGEVALVPPDAVSELPEDFNRTHRSVWVDIDPGLFDRDVLADCYERYIEQLVHAEACGFDGICVNEHHGNGYGLIPSPNVIASVLATRTSRAAITVLGNSVAPYNLRVSPRRWRWSTSCRAAG